MTRRIARLTSRYLAQPALIALLGSACGNSPSSVAGSGMVHAEDGRLVDGQRRTVRLRGVVFSNIEGSSSASQIDLTEQDYQHVADMGFGSIRLDFDALSQSDDAALLSWLDQQLVWARMQRLSVILALSQHPVVEPGRCVADRLWDQGESQDRLVASWQAIASRYAAEPTIAGYDLLHEPAPSADLEQWRSLANRLAHAIRDVDRAHLLVVEQAQFVGCTAVALWPDQSLPLLDDSNVLYGFEARGPTTFTTQSSARSAVIDGGTYPDELQLGTIDWQRMKFEGSDFAGAPALRAEDTDWTPKKHYYTPISPSIVIAQVNLRSSNNTGTVYFDDLTIDELSQSFRDVRQVLHADLEDATSWFLWQDPAGNATGVKGSSKEHHGGEGSITLTGTTSDASLSNDSPFIFPVTRDYTYRITGWMKGEQMEPAAQSMIGLSLWSYDGQLPLRDKANLAATVQPFIDWGRTERVPVFVTAFGTSAATFKAEKGGLNWVSDMLTVLDEGELGFCYDAYQGPDFGIYPAPDDAHQPLVDLFAERLPRAVQSSP